MTSQYPVNGGSFWTSDLLSEQRGYGPLVLPLLFRTDRGRVVSDVDDWWAVGFSLLLNRRVYGHVLPWRLISWEYSGPSFSSRGFPRNGSSVFINHWTSLEPRRVEIFHRGVSIGMVGRWSKPCSDLQDSGRPTRRPRGAGDTHVSTVVGSRRPGGLRRLLDEGWGWGPGEWHEETHVRQFRRPWVLLQPDGDVPERFSHRRESLMHHFLRRTSFLQVAHPDFSLYSALSRPSSQK